ncbi:MAG: hypothetical protein CHACPFDD_02726 [Phycisphaerae bacterium]|nr:hypothetical protein [Phycisphaerae bacterium]
MSAPAARSLADSPQRAQVHEIAGLLVVGLTAALVVRGHFVMPHPDFLEFADTGRELLAGHLPATLKRGPVYPLIVALLGRLLPVEAAPRVAAEWLSVLLLPLNGLLLWTLARRWADASAARWAAAWYLLLPLGLYCTSHAIVEPLLSALMLLTIVTVELGHWRWAYAAAALAAVTRYDAAGLLPGLFIADCLSRRSTVRAALATAAAALPLAAWLLLTALTWSTRSGDHYLLQIAERPGFAPAWAGHVVLQAAFDAPRFVLPSALQFLNDLSPACVQIGLALLAVVGAAAALAARRPAAWVALLAAAAYTLVHAAFPFRELRFGYPPVAILLAFAAVGVTRAAQVLSRPGLPQHWRTAAWAALLTLLACALWSEADTFAVRTGRRLPWSVTLTFLLMIGLVVLWAAPHLPVRRRLAQLSLLLAVLLLASVQVRAAIPLLGWGRDLQNQVEAARWIRDHAEPGAGVLSASPGLLRLYAPETPGAQFVAFADIRATEWDDVLAECRARHIAYIIWHDDLGREHGRYYAQKWRLERFDGLADAEHLPGVVLERRLAKHPNLVIVRILPER